MNALLLTVLALAIPASLAFDVTDANAQCFSVRERRNQKDLYASSLDCHDYIQCFYLSETEAVGFTRTCPKNSFFHEQVLTCMPEGATQCVDRCLDDATSAHGCYAGTGCRQYFVCSNTGSNGMCCPRGTTFQESTCSCEESATCSDSCVQTHPDVATTVAPATSFNSTVCQDSFGSYIATAPEANAFFLVDSEGHASTKMFCPAGYSFSHSSCRCDVESGAAVPPAPLARQATLYVTFDTNSDDSSYSNFEVELFNGAQQTHDDSALGGGSLAVNGGRAEVPGMKTFDMRNHGSYCGFFKCNGACSSGGILSNNKDNTNTHFTTILGTNGAGEFDVKVNFWHPVGQQAFTFPVTTPENGWNHFCNTFDGNTLTQYLNGEVRSAQNIAGFFFVSHAPLTIGSDQFLGTFDGLIDEVLVTPFAMSADEVAAHRSGNRAFLASSGFFDEFSLTGVPVAGGSGAGAAGAAKAQNNNNGQSGSTHGPP